MSRDKRDSSPRGNCQPFSQVNLRWYQIPETKISLICRTTYLFPSHKILIFRDLYHHPPKAYKPYPSHTNIQKQKPEIQTTLLPRPSNLIRSHKTLRPLPLFLSSHFVQHWIIRLTSIISNINHLDLSKQSFKASMSPIGWPSVHSEYLSSGALNLRKQLILSYKIS